MKYLYILFVLIGTIGKCQLLSNLDFAAAFLMNDRYPQNIENILNDKGFELINRSDDEFGKSSEYVLRKYDIYYYNVYVSKYGGLNCAILMFNEESKKQEYDKFVYNIKTYMRKVTETKKSNYLYIIYVDGGNNFFAYTSYYSPKIKGNIYLIEIMNFGAYDAYFLKNN